MPTVVARLEALERRYGGGDERVVFVFAGMLARGDPPTPGSFGLRLGEPDLDRLDDADDDEKENE